MATKTISLELDAYEVLRKAKRGGESFSAVVRRAHFSGEEGRQTSQVGEPVAPYGEIGTETARAERGGGRILPRGSLALRLDSFDAATGRQEQRQRNSGDQAVVDSPDPSGRGWRRDDLYEERMPRR